MDSEKILVIIRNTATITGCGISLFTFLGIIIKPLRTRIVNWFVKITHQDEIKDINTRFEINDKVLQEILTRLDELNKRTFENERDRLRGELFNCGNRCRRKLPLYSDEFRYIQDVYKKYHTELHENSIGTDEYNFIRDYFYSPLNQEMINGK